MDILGIDIGGSGIKGAIVDTSTGELKTERLRIPTPQPATPKAVSETVKSLVDQLKWNGPIGAGFPSAIQHGVAMTASNVDQSFIGTNLETMFSETCGLPVYVANDADVAGLAEFTFGEGHGMKGVVFMVTLGTGIGTAIVNNGVLMPNTELGHIWLENGQKAEPFAANSVRKNDELSWAEWGQRLNLYLNTLDKLFYPDLFVLGGGVSKHFDEYKAHLSTKAPIRTASFLNQSGIVGAALYAASQYK